MATNQSQYEEMCEVYERYNKGDLVPVVRCKDCKWHVTSEFYALGNDRVPYETISECLKWHDDVPVDFYCAFGERREDGKTEEVVRCKDCKYGEPNGRHGCKCYHYKLYETHEMSPNDFCSWGERKDNG